MSQLPSPTFKSSTPPPSSSKLQSIRRLSDVETPLFVRPLDSMASSVEVVEFEYPTAEVVKDNKEEECIDSDRSHFEITVEDSKLRMEEANCEQKDVGSDNHSIDSQEEDINYNHAEDSSEAAESSASNNKFCGRTGGDEDDEEKQEIS